MSELKKVMCVEDDPDIRSVLRFSLQKLAGLDVRLLEDGQKAIDAAPEFLPDMVLLDVMMPGLSGPETLVQLRTLPGMADVPVIFLTAKAMPHELETLLGHGALGVIVKPFDPIKLHDNLKVYWGQHRG